VAEKIDKSLGLSDNHAQALLFLIKDVYKFSDIKLIIDPYQKIITIRVFINEKEIWVAPKNPEVLEKIAEFLQIPYKIKFNEKKIE
jgi:hypothetical protein